MFYIRSRPKRLVCSVKHGWNPKTWATRLHLLHLNTLNRSILADVSELKSMRSRDLQALGRIEHPMIRHSGESEFTFITWDEAIKLIVGKVKATTSIPISLEVNP